MSTQNCSVVSRAELEFKAATRVQESFVAVVEKRVVVWLARRMPAWVTSDHLTVLGFLGQCLAGLCYAAARWNRYMLLGGIFFLAVNWFGDSLDGTLARERKRQRPRYGFYVDHLADSIAALFLMGGLALSGFVHPAIAIGMLVTFLMLSIEAYLASYTLGEFRLSYWKFGPTEIRMLLALGNLALLRWPVVNVLGARHLLFDVGGMIAIAGMTLMFLSFAIRHTATLYREERVL
jgi:archaetidylinositol phosphate synthase